MKITSIKGENLHIPRHGEPQDLGVVLGAGLGQDTDTHARLQEKKTVCFSVCLFPWLCQVSLPHLGSRSSSLNSDGT